MKLLTVKKLLLGGLVITTITALAFLAQKYGNNISTSVAPQSPTKSILNQPIQIKAPTIKYGFILDNFHVTENEIKKNEVLGAILQKHHVPYTQVDKLVQQSKDVFDLRKVRVGKKYMVLASDKDKAADYLIYEPSVFEYIVYDLKGETSAKVVKRPIETKVKEKSGVVTASLWNAIVDNGMSFEVASKMELALAWHVDFHHIAKGDCFKLIFEEQYIDGERVGVGQIQAAYFKNKGKEYYAYYYEDENYTGFFDEQGRPMKKAFLKSPVQYARISSAYNLRRFHPVLRRVKAHLGTDYAAPHGTPIQAVASGTVTKASRSRGNGNYVKIKHDKTYQTQYLHMSRFAKGMRPGVKVKQGDVIGYVGSTGLATGPHVCFRFWKNGKQVDHRKENLPPPNPMKGESLEKFKTIQADYEKRLAAIEFVKETNGEQSTAKKAIVDP
ncbi:MAG: peptidoglycan DD-metalloendopeptidase family protein [Saprospiraceae bacterium]